MSLLDSIELKSSVLMPIPACRPLFAQKLRKRPVSRLFALSMIRNLGGKNENFREVQS